MISVRLVSKLNKYERMFVIAAAYSRTNSPESRFWIMVRIETMQL